MPRYSDNTGHDQSIYMFNFNHVISAGAVRTVVVLNEVHGMAEFSNIMHATVVMSRAHCSSPGMCSISILEPRVTRTGKGLEL
jgi:hypothetical protein